MNILDILELNALQTSTPLSCYTRGEIVIIGYSTDPAFQVLVHAATGGVGLAAVQVCKALGAQVVATAGSSSKRRLLRESGLEAVVGSRDTHFATLLAPSGALRALINGVDSCHMTDRALE